jgi:hypothetical protein
MTGEFFAAKDAMLKQIDTDIRSLKQECQSKLAELRGDKSSYAEAMQARKFLELEFSDNTPVEHSENMLAMIEAAQAIDQVQQTQEAQASRVGTEYGARIQALELERAQLVKLAWHEDKTRARVSASSFDASQTKQTRAVLPLSTREQ